MKKLIRVLKYVVLAVAVLLALLGIWLVYLAKTRLPELDGVVSHASLKHEARVVRDDWGIPHIEAECETDAYFALGYAMAQDRLFQMELMLRVARGELAELLGSRLVPIDKILRSFRLRAKAEEVFAHKDRMPPEVMAATAAFVAGINHRVESEPLPFEFAVAGIPARVYTPADCLTVAAILPITFADGMREDPLVSMLKERHPDMDVDALTPGYGYDVPVTVMESLAEAEACLKEQTPAEARSDGPPLCEGLATLLAHLQSLSGLFGPVSGSNSWVLGPSRSKSGKPLLANDPHVGFMNPSVWYEAHIVYGDFDLYGHYLALIPFALLGHNRDKAWALTMFANDDVDLYVEKFDPEDPLKVMYKGEWADVETREETIKVRFGRDVKCRLRVTPHGAVMTDLFGMLDWGEAGEVSLSWVWQHLDYTDAEAFYRMGHARGVDAFGEAARLITSPGVNVSYADRDGNIAWWAAGVIPVRPAHVNPKQLLDGASGKDEILGYVPFEDNPHLENPEWGYIVTANNMSTVRPVGDVDLLQGYWQPVDRAGRIEHLLDQQDAWSLEELKAVQFDDTPYAAPAIVERLVEVLRAASGSLSPTEAGALEMLSDWDYRHNVESAGASVYHVMCDRLLEDALRDELGEGLFQAYCTVADHWSFFKHLVQDEGSPFWDDVGTPGKETRADVIVKSFKGMAAMLAAELGGDASQWAWGRIHTMEFKHPFGYLPLLGRIFNIGPFPSPGSAQVINNMMCGRGGPAYDVIAGPSTRRLIDFADPEHSLTVLPTGNSGNFMDPHYADNAEMFMAGQYREPRLTKEQIAAHKRHELRFMPVAR